MFKVGDRVEFIRGFYSKENPYKVLATVVGVLGGDIWVDWDEGEQNAKWHSSEFQLHKEETSEMAEPTLTLPISKIKEWANECDEVRSWMESKPELEEVLGTTYQRGQLFRNSSEVYQLCYVGLSRMILINTHNGNWWGESRLVKNLMAVMEEEFDKITTGESHEFTLIPGGRLIVDPCSV